MNLPACHDQFRSVIEELSPNCCATETEVYTTRRNRCESVTKQSDSDTNGSIFFPESYSVFSESAPLMTSIQ